MTTNPQNDPMDESDILELNLDEETAADAEDGDPAGSTGSAVEAGVETGGELGRLQQELEDLRNRSIRTLADYENYRKRVQREREQERRFAGFHLLQEFVEVVDNLERALAAEASADNLKVGVEMILKQMQEILQRAGVRRVPAEGQVFDHDVHEAVGRREDPTVAEPTVDQELQAGYTMHDRLLRPARVTVAMPVAQREGDEGAGLDDVDSDEEPK